jgi:hypothetical protein
MLGANSTIPQKARVSLCFSLMIFKFVSLVLRKNMGKHLTFARAEPQEVLPALAESDPMIGTRTEVQLREILSVVLPVADRTD